jgi:hypothetical protein
MSSSDPNPEIPLDTNCLYISTSQILSQPGKFHWSFFLTDEAGVATKHHWVEIYGGDYAEAYRSHIEERVSTYSNFVATFAYLKVRGFVSPGNEAFAETARNAFAENVRHGFKTVRENRCANLTCRTWVLSILEHLKALGCLKRNETREWFEEQVEEVSTEIEERSSTDGGLTKSFVGEI